MLFQKGELAGEYSVEFCALGKRNTKKEINGATGLSKSRHTYTLVLERAHLLQ